MPYPFRTALVTGASSGIGEAITRLLADDGVQTVVVARRAERLARLAAELPGIEILVADLATPAGLAAVVARIADPGRPVDLVVNNAGFGTSGLFAGLDAGRLGREIDLNVGALVRLSHAAINAWGTAGRPGWLLNVSSVAGFQASPGLAVYSATKSFVTAFSESIREELRPTGITVTALCPGLTRTEFQQISSAQGRSERFPGFVWMTAGAVAAKGLADVAAGRTLSIPGVLYRALVACSQAAPRALVRRAVGRLMRPQERAAPSTARR